MIYSEQAEKALLHSVLIDYESLYKVLDIISNEDFYLTRNNHIFKEMVEMFNRGEKIDLITLSNSLKGKSSLKEVGGNAYLSDLSELNSSVSNIVEYANIIKDKSIRRKLLKAQELNLTEIKNEELEIETVLSETQKRLFDIQNIKESDDSAKEIIEELDKVQNIYQEKYEKGEKYIGHSCGIEKIDNIIDGIRPSHIWVIGAFTSTGKTQFTLNIVNSLLEKNVPTSIISLEMSKVDLAARLMGIRAKMSSMKILKGKKDFEMFKAIEEQKNFLYNSPLRIHTNYFDLEKIKMLIRKDVYTKGIKVVVVDYVQNIMSEKGMKEYDLITKSSVDLQSLARELKITIILVSQISNEAEKGQAAGSGFKGSGALEAVADIAIRLKREKEKEHPNDEVVPLKIIVSKNRHGFTGVIDDYFLHLKSGLISINPMP